jgi:hypothetical protein
MNAVICTDGTSVEDLKALANVRYERLELASKVSTKAPYFMVMKMLLTRFLL